MKPAILASPRCPWSAGFSFQPGLMLSEAGQCCTVARARARPSSATDCLSSLWPRSPGWAVACVHHFARCPTPLLGLMPEPQSPELQQFVSLDLPGEAVLCSPKMLEIPTGAMISLAFQFQVKRCRDLKHSSVLIYTILRICYCANVDLHSLCDPGDGQKCIVIQP